MQNDISKTLEILARQIAKKYSIIEVTKLHNIEVSENVFNQIISEFCKFNITSNNVEFESLKGVILRGFSYFYKKGIEAAISKHFMLTSILKYNQNEMLQPFRAGFPYEIMDYINETALFEIQDTLYNYIIINKQKNNSEWDNVAELCKKILLISTKLGVELATLIPLKGKDFGIKIETNVNLKVDVLNESTYMFVINCPFCEHPVYSTVKSTEARHLEKIDNCEHVAIQYFQNQDEYFLMPETTKQSLSEAFNDFILDKDKVFMLSLNNFFERPEYSLNDFLMDIYVNNKISEEDELRFLTLFHELTSNYDLKASKCLVNGNVIVNYFMMEII